VISSGHAGYPPKSERQKGPSLEAFALSVAFSLDIFGDRWTLLVIRDLFYGRTRFKEFAGSPEGIPTNILTDRLERLLARGVIEQIPAEDGTKRLAYASLKKGSAWPGIEGDARLGTHVG
jgi:Predicted transcriptional regulators